MEDQGSAWKKERDENLELSLERLLLELEVYQINGNQVVKN